MIIAAWCFLNTFHLTILCDKFVTWILEVSMHGRARYFYFIFFSSFVHTGNNQTFPAFHDEFYKLLKG